MNNMFKILWFEDEAAWYKMEQLRVKSILAEHYLIPSITRKDGDDFQIEEISGNNYDLILMDYKLASGKKGDEIVSLIRKNDILTDILFYSSEEQNMIAAINNAMPTIDGVYLAKRDYELFTKKVEKLIDKIVKRSEDIVNLRGFVMDGSSDFEVRIKEILNIAWQKFEGSEKMELENAVSKTIERNEKRDKKTRDKVLKDNPTFPAVNNNIHFFCHSDRLYLLEKAISILIENYGMKTEIEFDGFKSKYENNVSQFRNALGHKKSTDSEIELIKGNIIPIDEDLHKLMRKNITQYNKLIKKLEDFVTQKM